MSATPGVRMKRFPLGRPPQGGGVRRKPSFGRFAGGLKRKMTGHPDTMNLINIDRLNELTDVIDYNKIIYWREGY